MDIRMNMAFLFEPEPGSRTTLLACQFRIYQALPFLRCECGAEYTSLGSFLLSNSRSEEPQGVSFGISNLPTNREKGKKHRKHRKHSASSNASILCQPP